ncbi:MAG: DUF3618 domain-containing protein [Sphingomonas sp.]|nr:DUF3618 domain-containing protein [Sphingomonas sp.]
MNNEMTDDNTQDPAAIEQDIRRTQQDMSRTVDKIGDQLTARNVFNALLDKADDNNVDARMLIDGARRNPIALGLIAAGAIWLVSDKNSKFPSVGSGNSGSSGDTDFDDSDTHHRDYVSHMSSVEMRDGEDFGAYQHRRDIARANFLMIERNHDEDEGGFRQRLDDMTDKFREKRRAWSDSSAQAADATRDKARLAADKAQDFYNSNPLVGGILAAAVGAAFGSALPITRQEQDKLGSVGEKARDVASEQKDQIASKLHEKKDELVEKADQKVQQSSSGQKGPQGQQGQQSPQPKPEFSRT